MKPLPLSTTSLLVNPNDVDVEDRTYFFPFFGDPFPLRESVRRLGVLCPPVVQRTSAGGLIPALGRRRLEAAGIMGLPKALCYVLDERVPITDVYEWAFWDNLPVRNWDPATRAYVVARLLDIFDRREVADKFLPWLGAPASGPVLERMSAVGRLDFRSLNKLATGAILEKTAVILTHRTETERHALLDMVDCLGLNANKAAECIERLHDLAVFHGAGVLDLLGRAEVRDIIGDVERPVKERGRAFRDLLELWKFPERVKRRADFQSWLSGVALPRNVTLVPAHEHEDEACVITVQTRDRNEAERAVAAFSKL